MLSKIQYTKGRHVVMSSWDRPIKTYTRDLFARLCGKGKEHALLFPADHAKDVLALQKTGVINGLTKLTLVEKNHGNMVKALRAVTRSGLGRSKGRGILPHTDMLHELNLRNNLHRNSKYGWLSQLDLVWLDLCGVFLNQEAEWTRRNAPYFMSYGADVLFTFQAALRGRSHGNAYFAQFDSGYEGEIRAEIREIGKLETMHVRNDGSIYYVPATPHTLRAVAIRRIGIRKLLPQWTFKMSHIAYKDRDPKTQHDDRGPVMIVLHLSDVDDA